ncbi:MAG: hypothetical protein LUD81_05630, partial [Clostridiales bacterium]|nr:hypothetical protein [Clostridiales bacterium]
MRKSAKRFLSTILALTLLCSCMAVMNINTVFAADASYIVSTFPSSTSNGKYYSLTDSSDTYGGTTSNPVSSDNRGLYYLRNSSSDALKTDSSSTVINGLTLQSSIYTSSSSGGGAVTFYADAGDLITVYYKAYNSSTTVSISKEVNSSRKITNALSTSDTTSDTSNITLFSYTATDGGVYYAGSTNTRIYIYAVTTTAATGNKYTITGSVNGLEADDTFTLTSSADDTVTYTAVVNDEADEYTVSEYAATAPFAADDTFIVSKDGYKVNDDDTATIKLSAVEDDAYSFIADTDLTFESDQYTISGKLLSSYDSSAISGTLYRKNGTGYETTSVTKTGFSFNIDKGEPETVYFGANDHYGKSETYSADSSSDVTLTKVTDITEGDGVTLNTDIFGVNAETNCQAYNIKLTNTYEINGYSLNGSSGNILVQLYDSSNNEAGRLQCSAGATISYTPAADGVMTIAAAASGGNAGDRGFTITNNEAYKFTGDNYKTKTDYTYELTAGTEYTITITGGAVNIWSIVFTPESSSESFVVDETAKTVKYTDSEGKATLYYIAGLTEEQAAEITEDTVCTLSNVTTEDGSAASISTVYEGVEIAGTTYSAETFGYKYVYGFTITDYPEGYDIDTYDMGILVTTYMLE